MKAFFFLFIFHFQEKQYGHRPFHGFSRNKGHQKLGTNSNSQQRQVLNTFCRKILSHLTCYCIELECNRCGMEMSVTDLLELTAQSFHPF